jgi:DNA-binding transcriptional MerR regulator
MKTDPQRAEQDEQILRLRCSGLSLRAIAARVGLSHQGVSDRITDAIRELVSPVAEEWRALETARLDDLTVRAYRVLDEAESGETALKAIAQLERLSASRRKLWALDMPQPIDIALSQRADAEGETVAAALSAALEALTVSGLDPARQEQLRVHALELARWKLLEMGQQDPGPPPEPPVSGIPDTTLSAEAPVSGQAGMEARLRDLLADEDVDVDALLREVDEEEGGADAE